MTLSDFGAFLTDLLAKASAAASSKQALIDENTNLKAQVADLQSQLASAQNVPQDIVDKLNQLQAALVDLAA